MDQPQPASAFPNWLPPGQLSLRRLCWLLIATPLILGLLPELYLAWCLAEFLLPLYLLFASACLVAGAPWIVLLCSRRLAWREKLQAVEYLAVLATTVCGFYHLARLIWWSLYA